MYRFLIQGWVASLAKKTMAILIADKPASHSSVLVCKSSSLGLKSVPFTPIFHQGVGLIVELRHAQNLHNWVNDLQFLTRILTKFLKRILLTKARRKDVQKSSDISVYNTINREEIKGI